MSGLLAIFILVLLYFILNFSQATAQLTQNDVTRAELLRFLQNELEREGIKVTIDDRHGILRISEGVLFDAELADVKPQGQIVISKLSGALEIALEAEQFKDRVETDDVAERQGRNNFFGERLRRYAPHCRQHNRRRSPRQSPNRHSIFHGAANRRRYEYRQICAEGADAMSLRESLKNLRGVAKILDAANFNPDMSALKNFVEKLGTIDKPIAPPTEKLKKLLAKFLRGEINFSRQNIRDLPFIIYADEITSRDTAEILRLMNFSRTTHLRRVMHVYLDNYDDSQKTEMLRRTLNQIRNVDSSRLRKIFAAREYFFGDNRFANMTEIFSRRLSIDAALDELGLSKSYCSSKFIHAALKNFFRNATLDARIKILHELDKNFDTYKIIFPTVADALIPAADKIAARKICTEIFYRRMGDPRFGDGRFVWQKVSPKSREIFCRWLAEDDLEIFFQITRETLKNNPAKLAMWDARENFWKEYLPRIGITWVVLGNNAQQTAYRLRDMRTHGRLLGKLDQDKSGFLFQLGDYIFVEWSHDGALRVYPKQRVENFIGNNFAKTTMMNVPVVDRWVHIGSWKKKVRPWIKANC